MNFRILPYNCLWTSQKPAFWNRKKYEYSEGYGKFQESLGLSGNEEEMEIDYGICSAQENLGFFPGWAA